MLKKSLRVRLTVIITLLVIILFTINAIVVASNARSRFEDILDIQYIETSKYYAEMADNWFNKSGAILQSASDAVRGSMDDLDGLRPMFASMVDRNASVSEVYYCTDQNQFVFGHYVAPADFTGTGRTWFTGAKEKQGEIFYTEPYVDQITGNLCISMSVATAGGVVGIDLVLTDMTDSISNPKDGYVLLATDQGSIVMHENPAFSLSADSVTNMADLIDGAYLDSMETDEVFTDYNGKRSYITAIPVEANGWQMAIVTPKSVYDAPINTIVNIFVMLTMFLGAIAAGAVACIGLYITKPLVAIANSVNGIVQTIKEGHGDLKRRVDCKCEDELGKIADGVNELMKELDELIPQAKRAAGNVTGHSEELVEITEHITTAIGDISRSVDEIAQGAMQQAEDVQSATQHVEQIGVAIDGVADKTNSLNQIAKEMQSASLETEQQVKTLQDSSAVMIDAIMHISEQIKETSRAVDNINEKVSAISEIATQTNLLSLNASIEAARAGEMGRGFAVVAEEIGKLALNSAQAAESIKQEMDQLLMSSQLAVEESNKVHSLTKTQQDELNETTDKIQTLLKQIGTTISHVSAIKQDVGQCVQSKTVIVDTMESLSAISEENAASSQETSATTEEIRATVENLANASHDMNSVATELNKNLNIFD